MDDKVFEACWKFYTDPDAKKFWKSLADLYGYPDKEKIRLDFKATRIKKGLPSKDSSDFVSLSQAKETPKPKMAQNPRVLVFDIETSPMTVMVWGLYEQRISSDNVLEDWFVLSYAAKWLCDDEVISNVLTSQEVKNRNDKRIVEEMWKLFDEADIVIAYNGNHFDIRKLNARFIYHDMKPPSPYQSIDPLLVARKSFSFSSNKLDFVNSYLSLGNKIHEGFDLWRKCYSANAEALKEMETYNRQDVVALEELYMKIRPWITSHPNLGVYLDTNETVCPKCGNAELSWKGFYFTPAGKYRAFRCECCGAVGRSKQNELDKDKRKSLVV